MKIWFQNRRTKWKKHENITTSEISEHKLQVEKNPDIAKAIQNAAKLKKAKERLEQAASATPKLDNNYSNCQPLNFSLEKLDSEKYKQLCEEKLTEIQNEFNDNKGRIHDKELDLRIEICQAKSDYLFNNIKNVCGENGQEDDNADFHLNKFRSLKDICEENVKIQSAQDFSLQYKSNAHLTLQNIDDVDVETPEDKEPPDGCDVISDSV